MALPSTHERIEGQTIMEVSDRFAALGFAGQFIARAGSLVECAQCGERSPASEVAMLRLARLEGPSDPGSQLIIAAVECPRCHERGTLTLAYGPGSPMVDAEVLSDLNDMRSATRPAESVRVPPAD
jgi:hypothetical protein